MPLITRFGSYILDWLTVIITVMIALALSTVNPDYHPFSLVDLDISYPHRHSAKVPFTLLLFLSVIAPALTIALTCLYLPPRHQSRPIKLWHLNASLLGLGVSLATSIVITTGVKNLTGKPRPDFLNCCQPALTSAAITAHTVGGLANSLSERWVLVDQRICQQLDLGLLNDGFRSFPSGYASLSFAGLWYISLFLSARFGVHAPTTHSSSSPAPVQTEIPLLLRPSNPPLRSAAPVLAPAAPPLILLVLPYLPLGLAIFVAGTRYFDFRNHGFDVLTGAGVGALTAWFGFRLYHPPVGSGELPWETRGGMGM